jgi:hypothetical protein
VRECDCRWGLDWWLDLLTTLTYNSWLRLFIAPSLISTLYIENVLSLFNLLCLHQLFPDNGFYQWWFFSFCSHFITSTAPTKSSLHRLPYNWLTFKLASVIKSRHGPRRKHCFQQFLYCCTWTCCRGNLFVSWSLPSKGSTCYNIFLFYSLKIYNN